MFSPGKTYVSRVDFNQEKTKALVFVSHVTSPEMGAGYLVLMKKSGATWLPEAVLSHEIY